MSDKDNAFTRLANKMKMNGIKPLSFETPKGIIDSMNKVLPVDIPNLTNGFAKANREKLERENQVIEGISTISETQPIIAKVLEEMASKANEASEHQKITNLIIIIITALSLLVGIINMLIAK